MINSKHSLIDATYTYPKYFYETIIVMFYDSLLFCMIPGIFIVSNNKKFEGYNLIFLYIKNYIKKLINKEVTNIC